MYKKPKLEKHETDVVLHKTFDHKDFQIEEIGKENVVAELYRQLKNQGIDSVISPGIKPDESSKYCRPDLVILDENSKAVAIVEVKNHSNPSEPVTANEGNNEKLNRYKKLDLDILGCGSMQQIPLVIQEIKKRL